MNHQFCIFTLAKICIFGALAGVVLTQFMEDPSYFKAAVILLCLGLILFL